MALGFFLKNDRIILTAALPYANGDLHLGHLVEHLQVDIWSRFLRMIGKECYTFCGDDTHGIPVMLSAQQEGVTCQEYIGKSQISHEEDLRAFHIDYTHYSNTHTLLNKKLCEFFFSELKKKESLVEKEIQQYYCNDCSVFLPDRMIIGSCPRCKAESQHGDVCDQCFTTYDAIELQNSICARCGGSPEIKTISHLFFSLEKYRKFLREWLPTYVDPSVYKKLLDWLNGPLKDWDITRDGPYFGFAIPGRENQYFYVWLDAPMGYLSCIQEWQQKKGSVESLQDFWNDSKTSIAHFVGKDIVYFHALFWPCLLESTQVYRKPDKLFVHGFLTVNGKKMSKSKGNYISLKSCLAQLNATQVRYYVTSQMQSGQEDMDFQIEEFQRKIDSEMVGKITNIASRSSALLHRYFEGQMSALSLKEVEMTNLFVISNKTKEEVYKAYWNRDFAAAVRCVRIFSEEINKFFDHFQPWKKAKTNPTETQNCLTTCLWHFRQMCIMLMPVVPEYTQKVQQWFGEESYTWKCLEDEWKCTQIAPYEHLMGRVNVDGLDKIFMGEN